MFLQFSDKSRIEVRNIFGGSKLVNGVLRDTLRIEIDPSVTNYDELCELFKDNPKTSVLNSITTQLDDDGNSIETVSHIGVGYTVFVSISNERIKKNPVPGQIEKPVYEDIFVVQISQQTYEEYTLYQNDISENKEN